MERGEAADTALSNLNHGPEEDEARTRPRREHVAYPRRASQCWASLIRRRRLTLSIRAESFPCDNDAAEEQKRGPPPTKRHCLR
ncbi:hypothetical protein MRX96_022704 [Rhipicephalus microplus]